LKKLNFREEKKGAKKYVGSLFSLGKVGCAAKKYDHQVGSMFCYAIIDTSTLPLRLGMILEKLSMGRERCGVHGPS
jgi:hypothetical protein